MAWGQNDTPVGDVSNLTRFLEFLGKAEGADYNTIVGGSRFNSYDAHPNIVGLRTADGPSTAAGRYQITGTTYRDVAPKLGITDFSPQSQDAIAVELIRRNGALNDVLSGDFNTAIGKLGRTWASLPSSPYNQPKKSWDQVNRMLGVQVADNSGNWWAKDAPVSDAGSGGNWWANDTPVETPKETPKEAPKPAAPQAASQAPTKPAAPRSILTRIDDFVRGAADTLTFGFADEFAAKMDQLTGLNTANRNAPLVAAQPQSYEAALAAQRQRDKEGGTERVVGQVAGALVPTGVGVIKGIQTAPNASRLVRAGYGAASGAATGAVQGGLYGAGSAEGDLGSRAEGAIEGAKVGAILGGATGGVLGGVLPATQGQKVTSAIDKAGSTEEAALKAEVAQALKREFENPARMVDGKRVPLSPQEMNQRVTKGFIDEAKAAIQALPKGFEGKEELRDALNKSINISMPALERLKTVPGGTDVANVIFRAQKADAMTKQMLQDPTLLGQAIRIGIDAIPPAIGGAVGGPGGAVVGLGLTKFIADPIAKRLTGKMTRTEVGEKVIKNVSGLSDDILARTGPSQAAKSTQALIEMANKAQAARQAQVSAGQATRAARVAKEANPQIAISELQSKDPTYLLGLSNPNGVPRNADQMAEFSRVLREQMEARIAKQTAAAERAKMVSDIAKGPQIDPRIAVLQDTRRPLSGAFQELLPGGRSNLNLTSDQAIEALRMVSRQFKDRPVGQAAKDILRSGNVSDEAAFYGLQNQVRKLQETGKLAGSPGALSAATAASPVRNPISYAEAVRTAGAAADLARANAPSKELAQFATRVAGIKSPDAKAKAVADRLAKTTDPTEQAFLTQFVEPLAQFGKK